MTLHPLISAALFTAALTAPAACSAPDPRAGEQSPAAASSVSSSALTTPPESPVTTDAIVKPIGGSVVYEDDLEVAVLSASRSRLGSYTAGRQPRGVDVVVTVKITNGTSAAFDAVLVQVDLTGGSAGNDAPSLVDIEGNIGDGFTGSIAPGRSRTVRYAFSVLPDDLGDIAVEVTPDFDHKPATFTGKVR